jgi:hypothetical protein
MSKNTGTFTSLANLLIWFNIAVGLFILFVMIPAYSADLPKWYKEFEGDGLLILLFPSLLAISCIVALLSISRLLKMIRVGGLHSPFAYKWVNILIGSSFAASLACVSLFVWLSIESALPPDIAYGLIISIPATATVGLVTLALKSVLVDATAAHQELDGLV